MSSHGMDQVLRSKSKRVGSHPGSAPIDVDSGAGRVRGFAGSRARGQRKAVRSRILRRGARSPAADHAGADQSGAQLQRAVCLRPSIGDNMTSSFASQIAASVAAIVVFATVAAEPLRSQAPAPQGPAAAPAAPIAIEGQAGTGQGARQVARGQPDGRISRARGLDLPSAQLRNRTQPPLPGGLSAAWLHGHRPGILRQQRRAAVPARRLPSGCTAPAPHAK